MARIIDQVLLTFFDFDVTSSESYEDPVEITSHPVESGLEVTDHAVLEPARLVLEGIVTDSPLASQGLPLPQRARGAYDRLLFLKDSKTLLTVITGMRVLQNMMIGNVALSRDEFTGESIRPVVTMKEVRIVASITIPIPPAILDVDVAAGAQSASKTTKQTGQVPGASTSAAASKTLARRAQEALGSNSPSVGDVIAGLT